MIVNKPFLISIYMFILLGCFTLLGCVHIPDQRVQAYSTPAATNVTQFYPSGLRNSSIRPGKCWETSLAAPRLDAWRCIASATIYDPCFSSPHYDNYVICDAAPVGDTRGLKITLIDALPRSTATSADHRPWTLRLSDGAVCTFLTGTAPIIDNQRVNYGCTNDAVIPGNPTMGSVWTVREELPGTNTLVTRQVTDAWT